MAGVGGVGAYNFVEVFRLVEETPHIHAGLLRNRVGSDEE
jgi:hypothetical protein